MLYVVEVECYRRKKIGLSREYTLYLICAFKRSGKKGFVGLDVAAD